MLCLIILPLSFFVLIMEHKRVHIVKALKGLKGVSCIKDRDIMWTWKFVVYLYSAK